MTTHEMSVDSPPSSETTPSLLQQHRMLRQLRHQIVLRYRPIVLQGSSPIRVMARMVAELEHICREHNISEEVIKAEIVNRTIGDVNLRMVTEYEGKPGGPRDYRLLADELGIALPNEQLHGYVASGETYLWLRNQMMDCERLLLAHKFDPRIYDILGIGNPVLRSWLSQEMHRWGFTTTIDNVYLSLGALDGIDKTLRGLRNMYRSQNISDVAILFPEPGFNLPEWQAMSFMYRLHHFPTRPQDHFKLTAEQLDDILATHSDIRIIYLTVTNNPTTFAYTADELNELHAVLRKYREAGRQVFILADLAYIGTGQPEDDAARMATFASADVFQNTIFVNSFSKTYTLTGERLGWVTIGNPEVAIAMAPGWTNSTASLPGEWQLRFMAYYRLIQSRPELADKLRAFYRLRRQRFIAQLRHLDAEQHLFEQVYIDDDATVYNWSKLKSGEDAFSLFEKTGIAGVPGSGFGYSDEYVRCSIGVIPVPEAQL